MADRDDVIVAGPWPRLRGGEVRARERADGRVEARVWGLKLFEWTPDGGAPAPDDVIWDDAQEGME